MRILFICGSAEPGKDGVGDYTRRMCGGLIRNNQDAQIISLCDHEATSFTKSSNQMVEQTTVIVHRIPVSASNNQRFIWLQEVVNNFQPDWISLQFVPYSFNPKGLPFWLPTFFKKIKGNHKWHIMFHELWLGIDKESSFKHKCIGKLQQRIVKKLVHQIQPRFNTTQNKLYQFFLQSHKIDADLLPICGNIPLTAEKKEQSDFIQFVLFGTIHPGAPFNDFIEDLKANLTKFKKPIKFVFIGKNGAELTTFTTILDKYKISHEVLGIQPENVISQVLVNSDFGISTTPYFQTEKSGVYAAYREHQIRTICVSRDWTPTKGQYVIPQIIKYEKNKLNIIPVEVQILDLHRLVTQFINSISKI